MPEEQNEIISEYKKKSLKTPILIVISIIIVGLIISLYFLLNNKTPQDASVKDANHHSLSADTKIFYFDLQDMLINLVSTNKKGNYLKISISIEFSESRTLDKLKTLKPRLIDQFQVFLRSLRVEELRGSSGLERIREELLRRTNLIVEPDKVTNILFREIVVQ